MSKGTALTIGKFNGFHLGHQVLLKHIIEEAGRADLSTTVLRLASTKLTGGDIFTAEESEAFLRESFSEIDRIETLDFSPELAGLSPEEFVRDVLVSKYNVKYIAVGIDFHFGKDRIGDTETLRHLGERYGFRVETKDKLRIDGEIVSSSRIKAELSQGRVEEAGKLLGRPYIISGRVESGKKLGRTLGYPTINESLIDGKILPRYGVYATKVLICQDDGVENYIEYSGITNIGIRPSVNDGDKPTVETYIYDFNDDIYGSNVIIEPIKYIRSERRFDNLEELTLQISKDIEMARSQHQ